MLHSPTSSSEVKERVELYLYSPCGPFIPCSSVNFTFYLTFLPYLPLILSTTLLSSALSSSGCHGLLNPNKRGTAILRNVRHYSVVETAQHLRSFEYSAAPLWDPQILRIWKQKFLFFLEVLLYKTFCTPKVFRAFRSLDYNNESNTKHLQSVVLCYHYKVLLHVSVLCEPTSGRK
jgi:hypothetical protein